MYEMLSMAYMISRTYALPIFLIPMYWPIDPAQLGNDLIGEG